MIEKNNKMFNEIKTNADPIKQSKDNTRDLQVSLTVNQDLVEKVKNQLRIVQNEMRENNADLRTIKNSRRPFEEKEHKSRRY